MAQAFDLRRLVHQTLGRLVELQSDGAIQWSGVNPSTGRCDPANACSEWFRRVLDGNQHHPRGGY